MRAFRPKRRKKSPNAACTFAASNQRSNIISDTTSRTISVFFGEYATDFAAMDDVWYNEEERRFLRIMELKPGEVSVETLKKQYKKLVKNIIPMSIMMIKTPKKNSNS